MPRDELRQPLRKRRLKDRLWAKRPSALTFASLSLAACFTAGGLWLSRLPSPLAGQPVVVAEIPAAAELVTSSTTPAPEEPAADEAESGGGDAYDPGATEITILDGHDSDGQDSDGHDSDGHDSDGQEPEGAQAPPPRAREEAAIFIAPHRPLKPAPIAAVTETTPQGPLPRISAQGRKPFEAYSQVTPMAVSTSRRPKITIILGGMGLDARLTKKAIQQLPGDITLGFAPYGEDLQAQVNEARARGHEILLQVPMEPTGYPAINPGPRTLLSDAPAQANLEALTWHMSRFAGYSGITNYMGARMLAREDAMKPVLQELKSRGLVYLEDGAVSVSQTAELAQRLRLPLQRAQTVIDADPSAPAIAAALARLEAEAARDGSAIATGSGLDVTIETVAEWAKTLQEKGILLVPVSAAYKGRAT